MMRQPDLIIGTEKASDAYTVSIGSGLLKEVVANLPRKIAGPRTRCVIVSNKKVFGLYGDTVAASLASAGIEYTVHLIGDGERFKNLRTLEQTLARFSSSCLSRTDLVVALGGGVVGDLAGFASSVYLRGVPYIQIPTTLLSMIDSSVGGKTGVNTAFGKNLVGSFFQPSAVIIDVDVLKTLPKREVTAGFCEAIKQGAISGRHLFEKTSAVIDSVASRGMGRALENLNGQVQVSELIYHQVAFKARIVSGDPNESVNKMGPRSRKILNFGHTFAHALEKVTDYRRFKHGEAVGFGIRFAADLSKRLEFLDETSVKLLNDVVRQAGIAEKVANIDPRAVLEAFYLDKKKANGKLHFILLRGIGKPAIVPESQIPQRMIKAAIRSLIKE